MKKLSTTFAAILVIVAIAAAVLWRQLSIEREQLTDLATRVADMEKAQLATATPAAPAPPPADTGSAQAIAPTPAPNTPGTAAPVSKSVAAGMAAVISQPAVLRRALEQQFPDAAKELDLTPAETDKFFALLAKQAAGAASSALGMLGGSGDGATQQESMRKLMEDQLSADKEMSALLGARRHQQWQEYQGTMAARMQVQQLRYMLGSGENALTEDKAKPLITALGYETARANRDIMGKLSADVKTSKTLLEDQLKYTSENNQRLVGAAAPYLSTSQLDRYRQLLERQEELARALMGPSGQGKSPSGNGAQR
jgi:hypothetical protein